MLLKRNMTIQAFYHETDEIDSSPAIQKVLTKARLPFRLKVDTSEIRFD